MPKLTDTQLVVLSVAAARDDRSVLPLPKSLKGGTAAKVLNALMRKRLIERIEDPRYAVEDSYRITQAGLQAINAEDCELAQKGDVAAEPDSGVTASANPEAPDTRADDGGRGGQNGVKTQPGTKQAKLIGLLSRKEGAIIAQMQEATGWMSHTCRGAMSGALKKKLSLTITSAKTGGERVYRIRRAS